MLYSTDMNTFFLEDIGVGPHIKFNSNSSNLWHVLLLTSNVSIVSKKNAKFALLRDSLYLLCSAGHLDENIEPKHMTYKCTNVHYLTRSFIAVSPSYVTCLLLLSSCTFAFVPVASVQMQNSGIVQLVAL